MKALAFLMAFALGVDSIQAETATGSDIQAVFARAQKGAPLRYVALGGSVTEAGKGWIGDWLKQTFPQSPVSVVNAGWSGTGSDLAVFRLERDVLQHQPDLVAIEFCVNDEGLGDEETIRFMESLVVRLKRSPHPPGILIIEAATEKGASLERHRRVAKRYGLLEVDLQEMMDRKLRETGSPWSQFFQDDVHPNSEGHALYARAIEKALQSLMPNSGASGEIRGSSMPAPLSSLPLLLNGKLVPLASRSGTEGWTRRDGFSPYLSPFLQGVLGAEAPGAVLDIRFRGTAAGLLFLQKDNHGSFYASLDGLPVELWQTGNRVAYGYRVWADLPDGEHRMQVVLPRIASDGGPVRNGPVHLAFALVAGESAASPEKSPAPPVVMPRDGVYFSCEGPWLWADSGIALVSGAKDARGDWMTQRTEPSGISWKEVPVGDALDFRKLSGRKEPFVANVSTVIHSDKDMESFLALQADYYLQAWWNREAVAALQSGRGSSQTYHLFPVRIKKGENHLVARVGAGMAGHRLACWIVRPQDPP